MDDFYDKKGYSLTTDLAEADIIYYDGFHAAKRHNCQCGSDHLNIFASKLGQQEVVEHDQTAFKNGIYGTPSRYYKKK